MTKLDAVLGHAEIQVKASLGVVRGPEMLLAPL